LGLGLFGLGCCLRFLGSWSSGALHESESFLIKGCVPKNHYIVNERRHCDLIRTLLMIRESEKTIFLFSLSPLFWSFPIVVNLVKIWEKPRFS
jgi:hypothetical protein